MSATNLTDILHSVPNQLSYFSSSCSKIASFIVNAVDSLELNRALKHFYNKSLNMLGELLCNLPLIAINTFVCLINDFFQIRLFFYYQNSCYYSAL